MQFQSKRANKKKDIFQKYHNLVINNILYKQWIFKKSIKEINKFYKSLNRWANIHYPVNNK